MSNTGFTTHYLFFDSFKHILIIYSMCVCVFLVQYLSGMKLNGLAALQHSSHGAMIEMVVSVKESFPSLLLLEEYFGNTDQLSHIETYHFMSN